MDLQSQENTHSDTDSSQKTLKQIFNSFKTQVHLYDGSKPMHPKDKPKKQKLFFGCNYADRPTICIQWSEKGRGFGEYTFWEENGQIYCDNEMDDKLTVMKILFIMVQQAKFGKIWKSRRKKKCSVLKVTSSSKQKSTTLRFNA